MGYRVAVVLVLLAVAMSAPISTAAAVSASDTGQGPAGPVWSVALPAPVVWLAADRGAETLAVVGRKLPATPAGGVLETFLDVYDRSGKVIWRRREGPDRMILGAGVTPDGSRVLVTQGVPVKPPSDLFDSTTLAFDRAGKLLWERQVTEPAAAFSPDGAFFVTVPGMVFEGPLLLWDSEGHKVWAREPVKDASIESCLFSDDGKRLLAAGIAGVYLYNLDGNLIWQHRLGQSPVAVASRDLERIAVGLFAGPSNTVLILGGTGETVGSLPVSWEVGLPRPAAGATLEGAGPLAINPDGTCLYVATRAGDLSWLWAFDMEGRLQWRRVFPSTKGIVEIHVSDNGAIVAAVVRTDSGVRSYVISREGAVLWWTELAGTGPCLSALSADGSFLVLTLETSLRAYDLSQLGRDAKPRG